MTSRTPLADACRRGQKNKQNLSRVNVAKLIIREGGCCTVGFLETGTDCQDCPMDGRFIDGKKCYMGSPGAEKERVKMAVNYLEYHNINLTKEPNDEQ